MGLNHRKFNYIRRASLNGRVHRHSFGETSYVKIFAEYPGKRAATVKHRRYVALLFCVFYGIVDKGFYPRKFFKILFYVLFRLVATYA